MQISLSLTPGQKYALDVTALDMGMAVSEFVRIAIEKEIRRCKK